MLDVVHKECDKKIYVTKTDIIEHKDDLVRKYLDKKEIVNVEQKDKHNSSLQKYHLSEYWNLINSNQRTQFTYWFHDRSKS